VEAGHPGVRASCSLKRELGDPRGIAQTLHNLGKLQFLRGDHGAAQSFVALAHVAREGGKRDAAIAYAQRALEAHSRIGDQRGITQARGLLRALGAG
jgi:hypothetical protein